MVNIKEHFKLTTIYTFFAAFPALLQLVVYPLIEGNDSLGAIDFGYLSITEAIISVASVFCLFGTGNGIARLYYDYQDDSDSSKKLISTVLNGIIARGLVLIGITLLFGSFIGQLFPDPALSKFTEYGPYLMVSALNRAIIAMSVSLFRHEKRIKAFILISLFSGLFRSAFQVYGVYFIDLSFVGYVQGTAVGGGLTAAATAIFLYKKCGFGLSKAINKELYKFSRPLFLSDLIFWGSLYIDRFFLIDNPDDLGIYDNALKFAVGIQFILQGLNSTIGPELYSYFKEGVDKKQKEIRVTANLYMAESIGVIILTIIPAMAFISFFYETELTLSAGLIAIAFVRFIFRAQYQIYLLPVMYSKKTMIIFYFSTAVLIVNTLLYFWLIPKYGYYGAITAFFIANFVQVIIFRIIQNKLLPIGWNQIKLFYFPLGIVIAASLLEIVKVYLNLNPYLTASILVFTTLVGYFILYRREIKKMGLIVMKKISNAE